MTNLAALTDQYRALNQELQRRESLRWMQARLANPGDLELALGNARQQREDMVLWLALQVMMTDDVALADDALQERLIILQDRIEDMMRARLGLPDRDAGHPAGNPRPLDTRQGLVYLYNHNLVQAIACKVSRRPG